MPAVLQMHGELKKYGWHKHGMFFLPVLCSVMDAAIRIGIHMLQLMGMLVTSITALRMFYTIAQHRFSTNATLLAQVRTRFVQGLLLAFEVLVAAGVLTTILHPSWSDIGKLAAIAALRTGIKKGLEYTI